MVFFISCLFTKTAYSQKIVAGFFGDWHTTAELNSVQYNKLTDIYYAFLKSDNSGNVSPTTANGFTNILTPMVSKAHAAGARCHVSLGGANNSGNLSTVINNATSRNNLVNSIKNVIQTYNLDGFNMDWEFPTGSDAANLAQFMVDMKAAMNSMESTLGRKLYLSAAVGPLLWNTDGINSTFINQCDYIYVMAFDAGGNCCVCDASNHSSFNIAKWSVEKWTNVGLPAANCGGNKAAMNAPASKIVLAIPFYSQSADYKVFSASDPAGYYNDADGVYGGHGYNSKPLIDQKINYIMNTIGGAGVWCWELPGDRNDQYSLLNAMWTGMQPYMCPFTQPNLGVDQSICGVSSVNLNSGVATATGRTFSWKKDGATIAGSSPTLTVTSAGTYEVTVTQSGCTKTDQIVVTNTLVPPDFSSVASALCSTLPFTLTPSNLSSYPGGTTWQWQKDGVNISGATSSSLTGIRTAGVYRLTATSGSCTSNSTKTLTSNVATPVDGSGPAGSAIPLSITNASGGPYTWYSAATGGTSLATGTSYSPVVSATTTYYVQDGSTTSFNVGPAGPANNWETSAGDADYINFTVSSTNATIAAVDVYVAGWVNLSSVVVKIWSSSGTLLFTSPSASYNNGSSSTRVKLTVPVGYNAAPGSYRLSVLSSGALVTNTLPTFPITNSNVSLTGVGGSLGAYPFAMNWKIGGGSNCARLPVIATVTAGVALPTVTSPVTYCQNATAAALTAAPASGGTLKWYGTNATGGTASATAPIPSTATAGTTSYYVSQTVGGTESARAKIDVIVNPLPVTPTANPAARCGTGTVVLGAAGAGTLNWYSASTGGTSLGTGTSFTTPSISATTTYYVSSTINGCTSARAVVVATVNTTPSVSATTPGSRCGTGTVVLGATASAGTLDWYSASTGGTSLGTGTSFTTPSITANTTYYVSATNNGCTSARTAVLATVNATPSVTATTPGSRCGTGTVVLGATASAGILNWYATTVSTTSLGTGTSFTTPSIAANTTYYVSATNNGCTSARTAVVATVNATPSVTATTPGSRCGTGTVVLGATASAGTLNWYATTVSTTSLGTGTSFTTPSISSNTTYYVSATNNGCTSARTAVTATINSTIAPSVSVSASQTTICSGSSVTFTATPTNGGTAPSYQWRRNGTNVGTNSATFTTSAISSGDVFTVVLTSNDACAAPATATSAGTTITIGTGLAPSVSVSASRTTICSGASVTFTATPINGGSSPSYQWKRNGTNVGTNSATFTTSAITNGDVFSVVLTSNAPCAVPASATSTGATITVSTIIAPSVSVSASQTSICSGGSVTFTAASINGGTAPSYQWKRNGTDVGTNSSTFTTSAISNGDVFTVVLTSNAPCVSSPTVTSGNTVITVNSAPAASSGFISSVASVAEGQNGVQYSVATVSNATSYEWSYSGTGAVINGNGNSNVAIDFQGGATSGTISVVAKNACGSSAPVTFNVAVSTSGTPNPGNMTTYTNPVLAGTSGVMYCVANVPGTTYQWSYDAPGVTINGNGSNCVTIDYSGFAASGTLSVVAISGNNAPSVPTTMAIEVQKATGVKAPLEGVALKAYPNPFEFTSTIQIEMMNGAEVGVDVYDVFGNKIQSLMSQEYLSAGTHEVNVNGLASGVYFVKLTIGDRQKTIKLIKQQ